MRYRPAMNDEEARHNAERFTPLTVIALLGATALAAGSLLPWATVQSVFSEISIDGMTALDGAGKWTLVCGLASAALLAGGAIPVPILPAATSFEASSSAATNIGSTASCSDSIHEPSQRLISNDVSSDGSDVAAWMRCISPRKGGQSGRYRGGYHATRHRSRLDDLLMNAPRGGTRKSPRCRPLEAVTTGAQC